LSAAFGTKLRGSTGVVGSSFRVGPVCARARGWEPGYIGSTSGTQSFPTTETEEKSLTSLPAEYLDSYLNQSSSSASISGSEGHSEDLTCSDPNAAVKTPMASTVPKSSDNYSGPEARPVPPGQLNLDEQRMLDLDLPPEETGLPTEALVPYAMMYDMKRVWNWLSNEPRYSLNAEHRAERLEIHQDHTDLIPVLAPMIIPSLVPEAVAANEVSASIIPRVAVASGEAGYIGEAEMVRVIEKGEKWIELIDELAFETHQTEVEHMIVSWKTRERVILRGSRQGINFENYDVRMVIAHTHPNIGGDILNAQMASPNDYGMLLTLGQRSSWLKAPGMEAFKFRLSDPEGERALQLFR